MTASRTDAQPAIGDRRLYDQFMEIARNRITTRQFNPDYEVPDEHYELILEAARHAPSGANAQPWHYIIVRSPAVKQEIANYFVEEQRFRAKLKMKFPTPNYAGIAGAPGLIVVVSDFRYVRAFPMLKDDDSDLNKMYIENAERILLQSVAASTMSAHLAAAALGYNVWWITAIGQQKAQDAMRPLLKVPDELSILDIMCFGPPLKEIYKRWKKTPEEIINWDAFNPDNFLSDEDLDKWIKEKRHKVMYKDAAKID
jgi:nitroreductase